MQRIIAVAQERRQTLNIIAWKTDGNVVEYKGWLVHHDHWRGGYVRLRNPVNGELRLVPYVYIISLNGYNIYL